MNNRKRTELLERRNESLVRQLDNAKLALKKEKDLNSESAKRANKLINDLEEIKENFENSLAEIQEQEQEYKELIDEMISFRNDLIKGVLPKRNIFRKIKNRLRR